MGGQVGGVQGQDAKGVETPGERVKEISDHDEITVERGLGTPKGWRNVSRMQNRKEGAPEHLQAATKSRDAGNLYQCSEGHRVG